jgi:hypothetical protein
MRCWTRHFLRNSLLVIFLINKVIALDAASLYLRLESERDTIQANFSDNHLP